MFLIVPIKTLPENSFSSFSSSFSSFKLEMELGGKVTLSKYQR